MTETIIGILLFALATMFLYAWGYVKEQRMPHDLQRKLLVKAERKIIKVLKRNENMTQKELSKTLQNIRVSNFASKKKLVLKDSEVFTKGVLSNMVKKGLIDINYKTTPKTYFIKNE